MTSFEALMALASKQTEASQIALAKETQIRKAREKAKRLEEERKEKERIRLEKERLARQKLEDEKREQKLLEERQKKMAERMAAAELARKQQELNSTPSSRVNNNKSISRNSQRSAPRASSSTPVNHFQDPEEKRMLEREEKKARARAKLFGEPVSAHKKPATFRVGTQSAPRLKNASKDTTSLKRTAAGNKPQILPGSSTSLTARQRIEHEFSTNERKPLNQIKKDRRTIDEIERDMKRKKALPFVGTSALSRKTQELSLERESEKQTSSRPLKPTVSNSVLNELHSSQRPTSEPTSTSKRKLSGPSAAPPSKRPLGPMGIPKSSNKSAAGGSKAPLHSNRTHKPRHNQSNDEYESESEEYSDHDDDVPVAPSIRDEIWKIMGKDRKQYTAKPIYSDEEGSDDMEADIDDVLEEEGRAARLARLEDQREEERLRQHELEKKKRLLQNRLSK